MSSLTNFVHYYPAKICLLKLVLMILFLYGKCNNIYSCKSTGFFFIVTFESLASFVIHPCFLSFWNLLGNPAKQHGQHENQDRHASGQRECQGTGIPLVQTSVPDPDPPDPHVFRPPGSGSTSQRYGSGSGSFYNHAKIVRKPLIPSVLWLFLTYYLWKMMKMYLQKVISRKNCVKN